MSLLTFHTTPLDHVLNCAIHKPWTLLAALVVIGGIAGAAIADSRDAAKARKARPQLFREATR